MNGPDRRQEKDRLNRQEAVSTKERQPSRTDANHFVLTFENNRPASELFGQFDQNLKLIEDKLGIDARARGNTVTIDTSTILVGKRIIGSAMYRPMLLPMMLENLVKKQGRLPFEKIVSNTYPLSQINEAFEQAEWRDRQTPVTRTMLVP